MKKIICIFCLKDKPPSVEHVMPRTLGGNLTIQDVCEKCNNDLSHLDQSLTEASLLVLPRLVEQPDASWGRSARLARTEETKQPLEIKLGHKLKSKMKTQLIFNMLDDSKEFVVRGSAENADQYESFFKVLRKRIKKKGLKGIQILKNLDDSHEIESGFRLVLNRRDEVVFRPSSEALARTEFSTMVGLLEKRFDEIEKSVLDAAKRAPFQEQNQPNVLLGITADFGRNLRAVSKIAYTFLAAIYGPDLLMTDPFTPLRQYILTGAGADDQGCLWWNGDDKEKSLGSSRFATWLNGLKKQPYSFGQPGIHTIAISQQKDRHIVMIEFYNEIAFAVDVGDIGVELSLPYVHEFDFVSRSNRLIPPQEILHRFMQKMKFSQEDP